MGGVGVSGGWVDGGRGGVGALELGHGGGRMQDGMVRSGRMRVEGRMQIVGAALGGVGVGIAQGGEGGQCRRCAAFVDFVRLDVLHCGCNGTVDSLDA
jgi:hypothetical protein